MRNATLKARVDAETEIAIGQKKIAAFSSAVDRNAKAQLKIADSRAAQAGVTRAARGTGRLHGVIACDDGSKTFDPSVRVMTIHRAEIGGSDAIEILQSYEHATTDDVIKALRRVEECDKPQTNGKSGYFDSPPVNKVINLAKGYLPTIVLHRLHGAPETFVDGAVAMKSDFVAIGQRWLDDLVQRMPDLEHVKHVADGLRALNLPEISLLRFQGISFRITQGCCLQDREAFSASLNLEKYGHALTRWVEAEMEAHLSLINDLGRANREKAEVEQQRAKALAPNASGKMVQMPLCRRPGLGQTAKSHMRSSTNS